MFRDKGTSLSLQLTCQGLNGSGTEMTNARFGGPFSITVRSSAKAILRILLQTVHATTRNGLELDQKIQPYLPFCAQRGTGLETIVALNW